MKVRWCVAGIVIVLSSLADGTLLACGDKFLVPSRGVRFELTPVARQQAAVLFYANPTTSLPGLLAKLSVDPAVRKAGYRPTVVATAEELDLTLRRSSWDVILLDVADGSPGLSGASGSPAVIAVAENSPSNAITTAKKQCATILKSPQRSQQFVQALDTAVATHQRARNKAAKPVC